MFLYKRPAHLLRAFLLEADDVQVEVLPEPVGFVEGDAPSQALPACLGTQTQPACGTQQELPLKDTTAPNHLQTGGV